MKPIKPTLIPAMIAAFLLLAAPAWAGQGNAEGEHHKTGILLVTFGTTYPAGKAAYNNIEARVKKAYPDTPVYWAYTAKMIRNILDKKGKDLKTPAQALADMQDQGFTHVAVQSLHLMRGEEFHDLRAVVRGFRSMHGSLQKITLGQPLLADSKSLEQVKQAMLKNIPEERGSNDAVIFIGHGTPHPSNAFYQAMAYKFQQADPLISLATVEGRPKLRDILPELKEKNPDTVYIQPFMSVAGDHAHKDMAGSGADSWKSILQRNGFQVKTVMKGMAEYDNIVKIWVDHLKKAMNRLELE